MHKVDDRVSVNGVEGTIQFIGPTEFKPGEWIGVALDTPVGKNDGSVDGVRYFTVDQGYGVFVRPTMLQNSGSNESRLKAVVRTLEDKVQTLRGQIDDLNNQLNVSKSAVTALEDSLEREIIDKMTLNERLELLEQNSKSSQLGEVTRPNDNAELEQYLLQIEQLRKLNMDLQSKVSLLSDSEMIIESLTVQNTEQADKLAEYKLAIEELENIVELDKDLEQNHLEVEAELKLEIDQLKQLLKDKADTIKNLELKLVKLERTVSVQRPDPVSKVDQSSEKLMAQLRHQESQLIKLRSQLDFWRVLALTEKLSLEEYSGFVSEVDDVSDQLFAMAKLVKFKVLCQQFEDFFVSQIGDVNNLDDYVFQWQCLENAYRLGALALEIGCIMKTCEYYKEVPEEVLSKTNDYMNSFELRYERNDYDLALEFSFDGPVKNREFTLMTLLLAMHTLEYCLLFIGTLQSGMILNEVRYGFTEEKKGLELLMDRVDREIRRLEDLEKQNCGLMNSIDLKIPQIDGFLSNLKDLDQRIKLGQEIVVFGNLVPPIDPTIHPLELEQAILPPSGTWVSVKETMVVDNSSSDQQQLVDELKLKISVLQGKLGKHESEELELIELTKSLESMKLSNTELTGKYEDVRRDYEEIRAKLQDTEKRLRLFGDESTQETYREFQNYDRAELVGEVASLRTLVSKLDRFNRSNEHHVLSKELDFIEEVSQLPKWDLSTDIDQKLDFEKLFKNMEEFKVPKLSQNGNNALKLHTKMMNIMMG
ncbi:hypothetical protein OGAPHI_004133 [Ogataea philodendri]|uniref:CAP-Gly domain-containing protein n=2 Tax=Saccharomycotina TaxID=147537 RepID=A0A9P8T553_9ASCO|nr:uncharacterized protein OGAPHI_004133 [Ogataea philodendri]KAH3665944.1 hypothetical protein OGAPHI_004133 [Ogataea philodendri]